jgi:hypothetical protein
MPSRLLLGFFLLLTLAGLALGQNVNGIILGTVTDRTGARMPGASVAVTNEATNIAFKTATGDEGNYVAPDLPPGSYSVRVEAKGFQPRALLEVRLLANRTVRIDVELEPGTVTQTVEVRAATPVVNTENATIGNIMDSRAVTTLPLNGRTLDRLIRISAGVTTDSASNPRVAGSAYWGGIQFNVDGVNYNDSGNGGAAYSFRNGLATVPSVDTISEFKIDSNNQKAEFESSAQVTLVTKSGSNQIHGSVLFFNRNKAYAARNAFATGLPKPPFNRNEYGYTVGGPVVRNRTFFFHSYEGLRERTARTNTLSVATAAMREGDFSGLPAILDPLAGVPFAGNRVPAARLDSRSRTLMERVPLPNQAGAGPAGTLANYIVNLSNISDINRWSARADHRFSNKDNIWVNLNYSKGFPYFVAQAYPAGYGSWENGGFSTQSANFTYNRNFTARTLNEFRFAFLRHGSTRQGMNRGFDPRSLFPALYPVAYGGLPNMNVLGHVAIGDYGGGDPGTQSNPQYTDNLTLVRGRHTIKTGFDITTHRASSPPFVPGLGSGLANNGALGRFDFNGRFTNSDAPRAAQPAHGFADYLLGYPTVSFRSTSSPVLLMYTTRYSAYLQDDWQVSPRLSISLGLRYMVQAVWKERDRAQANFDFASSRLVIPGTQLPPQSQTRLVQAYPIVLSGQANLPDNLLTTDTNNFGPRFGIAFRPFKDSKTVLRAGAGIYYNFLPVFIGFRQMGFNNPPFLLAETFEADPGARPSLTLASPFPGAGRLSPNPSLTAVERGIRNSESNQWNITLERELRANLGLRVSYVGNKTSHLPWYNYSVNVSRQQMPGAIQAARPYQPWADVLLLAGGADSTIHQLQVEAIQRYSNGLTFQLEYSWNRSLDNVPIVGGPEDPYNARRDRGNSDQIRRHIFTAAYSYELPFGPGKKFLNVRGVPGQIVGGWQIAGITYLRTGPPFSVSFAATQPGARSGRPDILSNASLSRSERSVNRWFDASAFRAPQPFTFGNAGRNLLFAPGDIVFDFSVLKDFSLTDRVRLQIRGEFFNMPNHTNLGGPASNISVAATVGRIFAAGDPRQIQFGGKILF